MSEELKNIEESFEILTEEENRIKSKSTLNSEDQRDLEAIKSLREEFIDLKNQTLLSQNLNENNDLPRTFTINMSATHENDEYRRNGISVIEPNLGVKLEDLANEIAGKPYITNFNNFEIDAKNYQTGAEIVGGKEIYWSNFLHFAGIKIKCQFEADCDK